jgi:signal transduction histidine kinase/CheY-like chemotaxis protein
LAGTLNGVGPFAHANTSESLLHLQSFMGTIAIAALVLAAVISEGRRAEHLLEVQDAVSRILAESPALKEAAAKIVQVLCERSGCDLGAVWNMDRASDELRCIEVWHPPSIQASQFEAVTREGRFTREIDLPGRVWSTGRAVWIPDVATDSNFRRAPVAIKEGLHSAFGFPIKLEDKTLGVIECFSREVREPDDRFLQMVSDIGGQIGQFMERKHADELVRQAKNDLVKANEELERRVQERTADLKQANVVLLRTIEEQKKLEEQLRQAQKMESIGTLAGGIAHDFNNILNIIQGYSDLIGREPLTEQQINECLKTIDQQIKRGASLVRQLLTVARKTETHLAPTDANSFVLTISELIKQSFPKTITVALDLDPGLPPVMADSNQLSQALLNICVNARDAMPAGGKLTVRTEKIDHSKVPDRSLEARTESYVLIVISDTGMGMEEEVRERIFEPFFTTKGIGEGTGLGLAIVYGIVKEHNGFIDVESKPGHGTTFRLYLPALWSEGKPAVDEIMGGKAATHANVQGTVLVVEDEESMVCLLIEVLSKAGYQTLTAMDGEEAIDLYNQHKEEIDIVVLDLGLPKVTGFDVMRNLKEQNPGVNIIITTGYLQPELKPELLQAGVKDCIYKPYSIDDLVDKVGSLIEHSEHHPS